VSQAPSGRGLKSSPRRTTSRLFRNPVEATVAILTNEGSERVAPQAAWVQIVGPKGFSLAPLPIHDSTV
jgi:hypothetical protein